MVDGHLTETDKVKTVVVIRRMSLPVVNKLNPFVESISFNFCLDILLRT